MKVLDSRLQLQSSHLFEQQQERHERLQFWLGQRPAQASDQQIPALSRGDPVRGLGQFLAQAPELLELSKPAQSLAPKKALMTAAKRDSAEEPIQDLEVMLLKLLVERFAGRKIELLKPSDLESKAEPMQVPESTSNQEEAVSSEQGWGLVYDYYESHQEREQMHFSATGKVLTADGQEIEVDLELGMSRQFYSEMHINLRAGDAQLTDPLVVNFAGTAAELGQRRFAFDLDRDGRLDQMAVLKQGSAYLALDKNQDGRINDGSELFGPTTGRGFAELAEYDQDGNGWIDEQDAIYERLRLWSRLEDDSDRLIGLGQVGIGAIYLGHVESPFLLKDQDNQLLGRVRETGLFLREDGSSGTLQELDLVV